MAVAVCCHFVASGNKAAYHRGMMFRDPAEHEEGTSRLQPVENRDDTIDVRLDAAFVIGPLAHGFHQARVEIVKPVFDVNSQDVGGRFQVSGSFSIRFRAGDRFRCRGSDEIVVVIVSRKILYDRRADQFGQG